MLLSLLFAGIIGFLGGLFFKKSQDATAGEKGDSVFPEPGLKKHWTDDNTDIEEHLQRHWTESLNNNDEAEDRDDDWEEEREDDWGDPWDQENE